MQSTIEAVLRYAALVLDKNQIDEPPVPDCLTAQQAKWIASSALYGRMAHLAESHPGREKAHRKEFLLLIRHAASWSYSPYLHLCYNLGYGSVSSPKKLKTEKTGRRLAIRGYDPHLAENPRNPFAQGGGPPAT